VLNAPNRSARAWSPLDSEHEILPPDNFAATCASLPNRTGVEPPEKINPPYPRSRARAAVRNAASAAPRVRRCSAGLPDIAAGPRPRCQVAAGHCAAPARWPRTAPATGARRLGGLRASAGEAGKAGPVSPRYPSFTHFSFVSIFTRVIRNRARLPRFPASATCARSDAPKKESRGVSRLAHSLDLPENTVIFFAVAHEALAVDQAVGVRA